MGSDNHQETHPTGWVVPIDPIDPLEIKFSRSLLEISPRSISPDRVGSRDRFEPARKPLLDSPLYLFYMRWRPRHSNICKDARDIIPTHLARITKLIKLNWKQLII